MQQVLLTSGMIIGILSPIGYIASIIRGKSKPHRTTRLVFLCVVTLNFLSLVAAHGNMGAKYFAGLFVVQSIVIFALSFRRGMGGTSAFDLFCLALAIAGLIGWQVTGNPDIGILLSIFAGAMAYAPATLKTWRYPSTESAWFYITGGLSSLLTVLSYPVSLDSGFQIFNGISCIIMLACIYRLKLFPAIKFGLMEQNEPA